MTALPTVPLEGGYGGPFQTDLFTILPPGGNVVAYVGSVVDGLPQSIKARMYSSMNDALAQCRSGEGDIVVVLPGYTGNVDSADDWSNLVAGTQIIGMGTGNNRPTFTWSVAAASVLINVANVTLSGCILLMAGPAGTTAITVAAPMTVSAAGFQLRGCRIQTEIDADQGTTIALTTTADADDMVIDGCHFHGDGDGTLTTTLIRLVGADRFRMTNTRVMGRTSTTVGVVQMLTTASTDVWIENCVFQNLIALSDTAFTGMAGALGVIKDCGFLILDTATTAGWDTPGGLQGIGNQCSNTAADGGAAQTPVST